MVDGSVGGGGSNGTHINRSREGLMLQKLVAACCSALRCVAV